MIQQDLRAGAQPSKSRGFSMLETLVTLFIISIWLLGSAGVQMIAMKLNKTSQSRNLAVALAAEMGERMEANKTAAVANTYVYDGSAVTLTTNCLTAVCNATDLATFDKYEWRARATASLLSPTLSITNASGASNPITYTITIGWSDQRTSQTYSTTSTDATEQSSFTTTKMIYQ